MPWNSTDYQTSEQRLVEYFMFADISIENSLLNDPTLINPLTGQPFNGRINVSMSNYFESRALELGERRQETSSFMCGQGLISRRQLMLTYGLTSAQATSFFQRQITLRFGAHGQVRSGIMDFNYRMRFFGDK